MTALTRVPNWSSGSTRRKLTYNTEGKSPQVFLSIEGMLEGSRHPAPPRVSRQSRATLVYRMQMCN